MIYMTNIRINETGWSFEVVGTLESGRISRIAEFGTLAEAKTYLAWHLANVTR